VLLYWRRDVLPNLVLKVEEQDKALDLSIKQIDEITKKVALEQSKTDIERKAQETANKKLAECENSKTAWYYWAGGGFIVGGLLVFFLKK
jgi:predicted RNA-binding protein with RPS1 domain